ncbi:Protein transport protein yos1 [Diplonema papillatum]|nr:Protein transport protein yos1 [Diplonema papillatum]
MGSSLFDLFKFCVLLLNAAAILSEKRFLRKFGFDSTPEAMGGEATIKAQIVRTLASIRLLATFPLIIVNTVIIVGAVLFG